MERLLSSEINFNTYEFISYTIEENLVWARLYKKQLQLLRHKAHPYFMALLEDLNLPLNRIPQLEEVSYTLRQRTGWSLVRVDGLIPYNEFFQLLANKLFPSTIKIRSSEKFSKDPDIFHEIFGHCPLLLDVDYSNFLHMIGKIGLNSTIIEQVLLQRLLWFSIEVGLIHTQFGFRIYGGALISSPEEAQYAINSNKVKIKEFNILEVCRSPFRADVLQSVYYYINSFKDLYNVDLSKQNISRIVREASALGEYPAKFKVEFNKYSSVGYF